jgi:hypothetical protein
MTDEPSDIDPPVSEPAQPEPTPVPSPPMDGNGKSESQTISDLVRKAREAIPVDDRGVQPIAYEQQVVIAKDLSKAHLMLPEHLHNNAAVLTALVGIAARFRLDPAMLASQSYVQGGKLCFQSQAFGAILYASGLLLGRLRYDFHGEGEDMTCTVSGRFRDDPDVICSATTPTLKQLHPGTVQKENKDGVKTFVRGSPLWDRDSEQQLGYFGQRRWIRRFAPDVCMGMYTREEVEEIDSYRAQREGAISLTADRLGGLDTGEGWGEGAHVDAELAELDKASPEELRDWPQELPDVPEEPSSPPHKPVQAKKPTGRVKAAPSRKTRPGRPSRRPRGRPLSRAAIQAVAKRAELPPARVVSAPSPKWLDYVAAASSWINAANDPDKAESRWDSERQERDSLRVPMGERSRLRAILDRKITQLRKAAKEQA